MVNGTGLDKELLENWFLKEIPNLEQLILVADFFNTSIDYLLGRIENSSSIFADDYEVLFYYNQLSKLDQRWIVGQIIDLIKKKSNKPKHESVAADSPNYEKGTENSGKSLPSNGTEGGKKVVKYFQIGVKL